jgi:hypothetical protein
MTALSTESRRPGRIEIQLCTVSQLFHTLDASPFREKDLARRRKLFRRLSQASVIVEGGPSG